MIFVLIHNLCSATIFTTYKVTGGKRRTTVTALPPLFMEFVVTYFVAQIWRLVEG